MSFRSSPATLCLNSPADGFHSDEELAHFPGAHEIDATGVQPGPSPEVYAFYRGNTQRNLYRIPVP